jgi:hypothetical protein
MATILRVKNAMFTLRYRRELSRTGSWHATAVALRVVKTSLTVHDVRMQPLEAVRWAMLSHRQDVSASGSHLEFAKVLVRHVC